MEGTSAENIGRRPIGPCLDPLDGILIRMHRSWAARMISTLFAVWFAVAFPIQVALGMPAMGGMEQMSAMGGGNSQTAVLACAHSRSSNGSPEQTNRRQRDSSHECCSAGCCCPALSAVEAPRNVVAPAPQWTASAADLNWKATCVAATRSAYARPFATAPPSSIV